MMSAQQMCLLHSVHSLRKKQGAVKKSQAAISVGITEGGNVLGIRASQYL